MSYNIHGLRNTDRVAAVVRGAAPDILIVQEALAWGRPQTWWADLAGRLGMRRAAGGLTGFGNTILAQPGVRVAGSWTLRYPWRLGEHPRAAVFTLLLVRGVTVTVVGSHLSTDPTVRLRQAARLRTELVDLVGPVIVGADVNDVPSSAAWRTLAAGLTDTAGGDITPTFGARRIDAVLVDGLTVAGYEVLDGGGASDHRPVLVTVDAAG